MYFIYTCATKEYRPFQETNAVVQVRKMKDMHLNILPKVAIYIATMYTGMGCDTPQRACIHFLLDVATHIKHTYNMYWLFYHYL